MTEIAIYHFMLRRHARIFVSSKRMLIAKSILKDKAGALLLDKTCPYSLSSFYPSLSLPMSPLAHKVKMACNCAISGAGANNERLNARSNERDKDRKPSFEASCPSPGNHESPSACRISFLLLRRNASLHKMGAAAKLPPA